MADFTDNDSLSCCSSWNLNVSIRLKTRIHSPNNTHKGVSGILRTAVEHFPQHHFPRTLHLAGRRDKMFSKKKKSETETSVSSNYQSSKATRTVALYCEKALIPRRQYGILSVCVQHWLSKISTFQQNENVHKQNLSFSGLSCVHKCLVKCNQLLMLPYLKQVKMYTDGCIHVPRSFHDARTALCGSASWRRRLLQSQSTCTGKKVV